MELIALMIMVGMPALLVYGIIRFFRSPAGIRGRSTRKYWKPEYDKVKVSHDRGGGFDPR